MASVSLPTPQNITAASRALAAGHLVVFPTETVYGLGADGLSAQAVAKIFRVKGRPADHPVILHVADLAHARSLAREWPPEADLLTDHLWPGPLTLILKRAPHVPDAVTGGQDTVGVRIPAHSVALKLLSEFSKIGSGVVAAPSANTFGGLSPTRAQDVHKDIGAHLQPEDMILDGGECAIGVESTIVDLSAGSARILRPGGVERAVIDSILKAAHRPTAPAHAAAADRHVPRVSGALESHYAPTTPLVVLSHGELAQKIRTERLARPAIRIGCLALHLPDRPPDPHDRSIVWTIMPAKAAAYAHDLYARLHDMDAMGFDLLLVEEPPFEPEWEAIRDRLARASAR